MSRGGRRGRPPRLTADDIGEAVLAVGFDRLTFAAVRDRLGVGESTLFRHAPDREALVRLGLGRMVELADWPRLEGGWRDVLTAHALCLWEVCRSHPGAATQVSPGLIPEAGARIADDLAVFLVDCGFTPEDAVLVCDLVHDLVIDSLRGWERLATLPEGTLAHELGAFPASGASPRRRAVAAARASALGRAPVEWFRAKLGILLDGVALRLAPGQGGPERGDSHGGQAMG
ncbi:TetR/AcrR family transcriptional regulator [Arachnia propionica]|uniref:TetR family transcriptional regulator n=1 Tax=Arachnia propionica TaxID=1750 RepID=A0A3P1WTT9_9ACTN|nr:TetR family transcriptional regulator [Arachnia propionica]RRD49705.1 TetR family transcriptional regulator [Arachnia propionica]